MNRKWKEQHGDLPPIQEGSEQVRLDLEGPDNVGHHSFTHTPYTGFDQTKITQESNLGHRYEVL